MIGPLPQYLDLHGCDRFPSLHLDRGYGSAKTRRLLEILGFEPHTAAKGQPRLPRTPSGWPQIDGER